MITVEEILTRKRAEVERLRKNPVSRERRRIHPSLANALRGPGLSVIAEIKRSSPSTGEFEVDIFELRDAYMEAGVDGLSILTDEHFGMEAEDLYRLADGCMLPVLRKDFVLSKEQIDEAWALGADAVLLIAGILDAAALAELGAHAKSLGLDVLYETHAVEEIAMIPAGATIVGVNNRNLRSPAYHTDVSFAKRALAALPARAIKVAESGYDSGTAVPDGYDAVLIGTGLIREFKRSGSVIAAVRRIRDRDRRIES